MNFKIISLGCPKNLVESEYIARRLEEAGHVNSEDWDTIIINTCAFITDAVKESIDVILTQADSLDKKRLIVIGCLVERYKEKLIELLPEVDAFIGRGDYPQIEELIEKKGYFYKKSRFSETYPRKVFTAKPTAYLKIMDGCNNMCSYCTVPHIRGPIVSRSIEDIEIEFRWLLENGYKEINIIGQDICSYGIDIGRDLKELLRHLLHIDGDYYLRLLYLHPLRIDDELLSIVKDEGRIIKYLDIPIQHSEDRILKLMNRGYTKAYLEGLLGKVREEMPDCILRSTVITGFPDETEEEFQSLCDFIKKWRFDNLGAFKYSKEEGTPAYRFKGHIKKGIKEKRFKSIMEIQRDISRANLKRLEGKESLVIVEERDTMGMTGRIILQSPDIDGIAFIRGNGNIGEIRPCKIVKTLDYDVIVETLDR
ncbi:MAG: 30S ribosomal protein S12 methylthiotransferase RimO [Syntrophorhabdaceae bacterium]|nr:30S ribosomal protein S12 methylthiotransferase RimO [Syntrophorhabdaceae bacterium]